MPHMVVVNVKTQLCFFNRTEKTWADGFLLGMMPKPSKPVPFYTLNSSLKTELLTLSLRVSPARLRRTLVFVVSLLMTIDER